MSKRYPIVIKSGFQKGLIAFKSSLFGAGIDLAVVRLKRNVPGGAEFEREDIKDIEVDLHFADRESLERTVSLLRAALDAWDKEETEA